MTVQQSFYGEGQERADSADAVLSADPHRPLPERHRPLACPIPPSPVVD